MNKRSYLWIAAVCVAVAVLLLALAGQAGATPTTPPGQGAPAAGHAAPEGTVVLGPAEWAVWANIPGPSRNGTEDCVYAAPTQGGAAPETVQIGWGPLPASGAGGRFPALPAEWLRQWWGNLPDEREAMRGSLEVGLRQVRSDGSQPVCRAVEIEPAVCKPAKTTAALAAGFTLTGDGKYVLFPVTGLDWDSPEVAFMLWTSQSPECGASTATPTPTATPTGTASPTATPTSTSTPTPGVCRTGSLVVSYGSNQASWAFEPGTAPVPHQLFNGTRGVLPVGMLVTATASGGQLLQATVWEVGSPHPWYHDLPGRRNAWQFKGVWPPPTSIDWGGQPLVLRAGDAEYTVLLGYWDGGTPCTGAFRVKWDPHLLFLPLVMR